ncbi:pyruvate kinase [Paenibacillus sp. F411]|uniref:pyruvate kinase n=1 Tax=Paenibacillus sp. F411 TaxID=2820239 RepID=UPI001FB9AAAD|nr:pyruvate kinase [Paenibacillus sp. F411]
MLFDIEKIYQEYLTLNIPHRFTLSNIHKRLTTRYNATQVDVSNFSALRMDPYACYDSAITAYTFRDDNAIKELIQLNRDLELSGGDINLIINSTDKTYITGSTLQGISNLLALELEIFWGMDEEEMFLGNKRFEEYLIMLYLTGHIQFENDSIIDYIRDRYKNGYYLRYFGTNDGAELYLDDIIIQS